MKLLGAVIVLVVLCLVGLWAAFYGPGVPLRRDDGHVVSSGPDTGAPQRATLGQFSPLARPRPAPELEVSARDGHPVRLADFRGRFVLVNLWATWCAPCVREMPSLDRLQARLGDRLAVMAISEDRGAGAVVDPFLAQHEIERLSVYLDPKMAATQAFRPEGLPATYLIDPQGRILGFVEGGAEWDSPAMLERLDKYLARGTGGSGPLKTSATP
jgi:thiol-disulfide isomerase/thioredoxin